MILSSRKLNENYIIDILGKLINGVKSVSILGLSFKGTPPTNDIRDSYALTLIDFLKSKSIEVSSYDPLVFDEDFKSIKLTKALGFASIDWIKKNRPKN